MQNGCHAPAFAALSLIAVTLLRVGGVPSNVLGQSLTIVIAMLLTGAATEGVQSLFGRDAEFDDVVSDVVGTLGAMGIWLYLQWRHSSVRMGRIAALFVCAAAVTYWLDPFAECARAYWNRYAQFPVLAQFHSKSDLYFVSSSGTDTRVVGTALQATLASGPWPGFTFSEPMADWRKYRVLNLDVGNPGSRELPLILRVNDRAHRGDSDDRFNLDFSLGPHARTTIRVPLEDIARSPRGRKMDMSQISQLIVFRNGGAPGQVLQLHEVWLEQ
jgi:Complex I intermediate-associated protein 30 (CIA30)